MRFSRKATIEDFEKEIGDYTEYFSPYIKNLIHTGRIQEAKKQIVDCSGASFREARKWIYEYLNYYNAFTDFKDGKEVYVNY